MEGGGIEDVAELLRELFQSVELVEGIVSEVLLESTADSCVRLERDHREGSGQN